MSHIIIQCLRKSLQTSPRLIGRSLKSRILQVFDLSLSRQLAGAASLATGLRRKNSTLSFGDCLTRSSCVQTVLVRQSNRFCSKDKSSALRGHRRNGMPYQNDTSQVIFAHRLRSLLFVMKRVLDWDFSHRSDRLERSVRPRFA
jgi:hypothetical protein